MTTYDKYKPNFWIFTIISLISKLENRRVKN